jgi:hypothetical protein
MRELPHLADFFAFARARHEIYMRRAARLPAPWSEDPIFHEHKFTNIFRELDRTTVWIRENIRDELDRRVRTGQVPPVVLLFGVIAARWFNRTETLQAILDFSARRCNDPWKIFEPDTWVEYEYDLAAELRNRLKTFVTGAYMIKTPTGMPKLNGIMTVIRRSISGRIPFDGGEVILAELADHLMSHRGRVTLQAVTEALTEVDHLGPFLAYEIVTDLRHTHLLDGAHDITTWANPGPGAARGIVRLQGRWEDPAMIRPSGKRAGQRYRKAWHMITRTEALDVMRHVLEASLLPEAWPSHWPRWEMREVEHTLCEFDKYCRIKNGEGKTKEKFVPKTTY